MSTSTSINLFNVDAFDSESRKAFVRSSANVLVPSDSLNEPDAVTVTSDGSIFTLDIKVASIFIAIPGGAPNGNP